MLVPLPRTIDLMASLLRPTWQRVRSQQGSWTKASSPGSSSARARSLGMLDDSVLK